MIVVSDLNFYTLNINKVQKLSTWSAGSERKYYIHHINLASDPQ